MGGWRRTQIRLVLTSLGITLAVGVAALIETTIAIDGGPRWPAVWWAAYALLFAALLMVHGYLPHPRWLSVDALLLTMIALGIALVLLFARQSWTTMLFFMTATMTAFFWSSRATYTLIGVQTTMVVVAGWIGGWSSVDLVVGTIVFGVSQVFAALVVYTARSEADARRELAAAHAELRSTAALLEVTTREAERLRIARDLHDVAGHQLTALSLELEVASHLTSGSEGEPHVVRARTVAKELLGTVRTAVGEMRADLPSLEPALRDLAAGIPGLNVTVEARHPLDLDVDQTVTILRCVQEAITNTLRHTDARSIRIVVDADEREVRVSIADDGDGTAAIVPGNGLTGMQERFAALGGALVTRSEPGAGFAVLGSLPRSSS